MSVFVRYKVRVLVEVDLTAGRVLSVQVDDETATGPEGVFAIDEPPLGDGHRQRAVEIIERATWPVWEFGL